MEQYPSVEVAWLGRAIGKDLYSLRKSRLTCTVTDRHCDSLRDHVHDEKEELSCLWKT